MELQPLNTSSNSNNSNGLIVEQQQQFGIVANTSSDNLLLSSGSNNSNQSNNNNNNSTDNSSSTTTTFISSNNTSTTTTAINSPIINSPPVTSSNNSNSNNNNNVNNSNNKVPTGNTTIQRTLEKDIMMSLGKHIVVTSSQSSAPTIKTFDEIIVFFKERLIETNDKINYWVELQSLDEGEIREICELLGVHSLTINDIVESDTREKCEYFSNHLFVVIHEIHYEDGSNNLVSGCLNMILFKNMILTFHQKPIISTSQVMRMIKYSPTGMLPSASWIIYAYLDGITDIYIDLVDKLMLETQSLDELLLVLTGMKQNELFTRIGMAGRRVISLHSGIFGKSEIISGLLRDEKLIPANMFRYLRNVQDHVYRMLQKLTLSQRLLANVNNIYMARMSLEVSESSNLVNYSMRKFTAVSVIFVPLSLIAGVFGMNVRLPAMVGFFPGGNDYYFFIGLMITMFLIALFSIIFFRRYRWI